MQIEKKIKKRIEPKEIRDLLYNHYSKVMSEFYEMQSSFLSIRYKVHQSIETSLVLISLIRNIHLSIIRKREKNLDHDISLDNFILNLEGLDFDENGQKIISIVKTTGIPKETVRRKLKKLIQNGFIKKNKNREFFWNLSEKRQHNFINIMNSDISALAKLTFGFLKHLDINLNQKVIENEIKSQFSFYFYHFYHSQLLWLRMWQTKIKDIDLIFIALQVIIPTLQYADKNENLKELGLENIYTLIGKTNDNYKSSATAVSAASISEITGIPRVTCIRKLEKLVKLGLLVREIKTKRYFVNQITASRTKNIITKDNIHFTVEIFSEYLSIIINALTRKNE